MAATRAKTTKAKTQTKAKAASGATKKTRRRSSTKKADPMAGVFQCRGDCTIYEIAGLKQQLQAYMNNIQHEIVIDLAGVGRVDASFIQLLITAQAAALKNGKTFRLNNPSDSVTELARLFHVQATFSQEAA